MLSSSLLNISKWWITIRISWVKYTTYRINFFLQIIGPALMFFFIKYNLWTAIYSADKNIIIKGISLEQMINYHIWILFVGIIGQGHASWNLSDDIRLGRISNYLIYPFNLWEFHTANFIAFQFLQLLIVSFTLTLFTLLGWLILPDPFLLLNGLLFTVFVSFFWYTIQYFTGIMAFWLEETWILRVILMMITNFLSGAIIPLDLYPQWITTTLTYTPFPYLAHFPVQILQGKDVALFNGYLIITLWTFIFALCSRYIWRKGLRLYTAAGM